MLCNLSAGLVELEVWLLGGSEGLGFRGLEGPYKADYKGSLKLHGSFSGLEYMVPISRFQCRFPVPKP